MAPGEYDAILMDVQMPGMDGYEATRTIRSGANPLGRTIPIIAMTANAFAEDVKKSLDAGMNAHLSKPVDLNALEQTLALPLRTVCGAAAITDSIKALPLDFQRQGFLFAVRAHEWWKRQQEFGAISWKMKGNCNKKLFLKMGVAALHL